MTRTEFSKGILYLSAAIDKEISDARLDAYFDMLSHHGYDTFIVACKRVMLSHPWNSFPSAAELNDAAMELSTNRGLTSGEAWALARDAAMRIDPDQSGPHRIYHGEGKYTEYPSQAASVLKDLPPAVAKAISVYGLHEFCLGDNPDGVVRAQFTKIFEQLETRDKREAALPPSVRALIENRKPVAQVLAGIGGMPK